MDIAPAQMRRYGQLAGFLFVVAALAALPGVALLTDGIDRDAAMITGLAVVSGIVCLTAVPWETLPEWGLYPLTVLATGEVALAAEVVDPVYRVLYFIVVAYAALVLPGRVGVAAILGLILIVLVEPAINSNDTREQLGTLIFYTPALAIVAGMIRYLQETLERREGRTRAYAREAVELAIRLRGGEDAPARHGSEAELAELKRSLEKLN